MVQKGWFNSKFQIIKYQIIQMISLHNKLLKKMKKKKKIFLKKKKKKKKKNFNL